MTKYRKRPVEVEAVQWFRNGDDTEVFPEAVTVDYGHCGHCGHTMDDHGWIDTLEGGHIVCPGDWVITGVKGERYPCKPDIFAETYEPVSVEP